MKCKKIIHSLFILAVGVLSHLLGAIVLVGSPFYTKAHSASASEFDAVSSQNRQEALQVLSQKTSAQVDGSISDSDAIALAQLYQWIGDLRFKHSPIPYRFELPDEFTKETLVVEPKNFVDTISKLQKVSGKIGFRFLISKAFHTGRSGSVLHFLDQRISSFVAGKPDEETGDPQGENLSIEPQRKKTRDSQRPAVIRISNFGTRSVFRDELPSAVTLAHILVREAEKSSCRGSPNSPEGCLENRWDSDTVSLLFDLLVAGYCSNCHKDEKKEAFYLAVRTAQKLGDTAELFKSLQATIDQAASMNLDFSSKDSLTFEELNSR